MPDPKHDATETPKGPTAMAQGVFVAAVVVLIAAMVVALSLT
jgi:hypothetical protein